MEEKEIKLSELIAICEKYVTEPSVENMKSYDDLVTNLKIKSYLKYWDKVGVLLTISNLSMCSVEDSLPVVAAQIDSALLLVGLLRYTNVVVDVLYSDINLEKCDYLFESGLADYIEKYCERDYKRLRKMLERAFSFDGLLAMQETLASVDSAKMADVLKVFGDSLNQLSPEVAESLEKIVEYNDPTLYRMKHDVADAALDQIDKLDKLENEVYN